MWLYRKVNNVFALFDYNLLSAYLFILLHFIVLHPRWFACDIGQKKQTADQPEHPNAAYAGPW